MDKIQFSAFVLRSNDKILTKKFHHLQVNGPFCKITVPIHARVFSPNGVFLVRVKQIQLKLGHLIKRECKN